MKNIILVGVVSAVLGGMTLIGYLNKPTVAVNTKTVIEEVHPEWATDEDAKAAAEAVIQRKVWEADKERLESSINELQAELDTVDKALGSY